jgi:hypothetical protein
MELFACAEDERFQSSVLFAEQIQAIHEYAQTAQATTVIGSFPTCSGSIRCV